jgi:hypothetical protein
MFAVITVPVLLIAAFGLLALKWSRQPDSEASEMGPAVATQKQANETNRRGAGNKKSVGNDPSRKTDATETLSKKFSRLLAEEVERKSGGKTRLNRAPQPKVPPRDADRPNRTADRSPTGPPPDVSNAGDRVTLDLDSRDRPSSGGIQTLVARTPGELDDVSQDRLIGRLIITGDLFDNRSLRKLQDSQVLSISIEAVNVTNAGLHHLSKVKFLRELRIWAPEVNDNGLSILANISNLERLDLEGTNVSGVTLTDLAALPRLQSLTLGPRVPDGELEQLQEFPALQELDLRACRLLTDACVTSLGALQNLQVLWLPKQISAPAQKAIRESLAQCQIRL